VLLLSQYRISLVIVAFFGSCDDDTQSDYLEFSNFQNAHDKKLQRYCGTSQPLNVLQNPVISEGSFMQMSFVSNGVTDGTGFEATFTFFEQGMGD